jgi:uncharacterized RDD family membrane protein YckC
MSVNPYAAPSADVNADFAVAETALASRGSRLGASLIDGLIYVVPYVLLVIGAKAQSSIALIIGSLGFLALAIYQIVQAVTKGQTLGKRLVGIKVVKLDGSPVDFVTIVIMRGLVGQFLLGIVPLYGLIDALFIFKEEQRCLHDLVGSTKVVEAK